MRNENDSSSDEQLPVEQKQDKGGQDVSDNDSVMDIEENTGVTEKQKVVSGTLLLILFLE